MEQYFSNLFEDIRHERSLILLMSLVEPDILKQSNFTDHEIIIKNGLVLEKVHRQWILKESVVIALLELELE